MTELQLGPTVFVAGGGALGLGRIAAGLPFVGDIHSPFGTRIITEELRRAGATQPYHGAIDISSNGPGVPFGCPVSGRVVRADDATAPGEWYKGFWLEVETLDGEWRVGTYHLAEAAQDYETGIDLGPGDIVRRGQIVGVVGTTGASTGEHSHFYVLAKDATAWNGWRPVNPITYFVERLTYTANAFPALRRGQLGAALMDEAHVHAVLITRDAAAIGNADTYRVNIGRDGTTGAPV